jgi:hypothetical protein
MKNAKKQEFQPLTKELEARIDAYIASLQVKVNGEVDEVEGRTRARATQIVPDAATVMGRGSIEATRASLVSVDARMGSSYAGFGFVGMILGAAAGAGLGYAGLQSPQIVDLVTQNLPTVPQTVEAFAAGGGAAGAAVGLILGLLARTVGSTEAQKNKINQRISERVEAVMQKATKEQVLQALDSRRGTFRLSLQGVFDKATGALSEQISKILAEEEAIKKEQEAVIARLEPKISMLHELGDKAREIVSAGLSRRDAEVA